MRFACDVKLSGVSLVAERRHCGEAFPWSPGDNPDPLVAFVGEQFVAVGDGVYRKDVNGTLLPLDLKLACVFLRPVAGDALVQLSVDEFAQSWAVLEDVPVVVEDPATAPIGDPIYTLPEAAAPFEAKAQEVAASQGATPSGSAEKAQAIADAQEGDFDFSAPEPLPPVEDFPEAIPAAPVHEQHGY